MPKGDNAGRPLTWTKEVLDEEARLLDEQVGKVLKSGEYFSLQKWCLKRRFYPEDFPEFGERSPLFRKSLSRAKKAAEASVIEKALDGTANAGFTKFLLACNHGWIEEKDRRSLDLREKEIEQRAKEATAQSQMIQVMLDQTPSSDEVPEKG